MLGCTLALRLAQRGHKVTLFEASDRLGGLADAWNVGPFTWDRHYHVTLMSDAFTVALLREIGIEDKLVWAETKTGFFTGGRLYSMSNSFEFLKFPPLALIDKFRLGGTIMVASRIDDWRKMEQIPVAEWLTRLSGRRTFEKMWLPLLRAKLGEAWQETSAAFIWATIQRMYAARKSGLKKEMFGYVEGGYATTVEALGKALERAGVDVRLSTPTKSVSGGVTVDGERFDSAVLTVAPVLADRMTQGLKDGERSRLKNLRYQGIVCASVVLNKPLSPYYVTNITDEWVPFTGVIEMTALVDPKVFGGRGLVYLPKYVAPDHPLLDADDATVERRFLDALMRMYPHLKYSDVQAFKVSRVRHVFPIPTINYSAGVPAIKTSVDGVFHLSSANILNGTLNVNETIALAEKSVETIDG